MIKPPQATPTKIKSTPELYLDMKLVIEDKEYYKESGFNA